MGYCNRGRYQQYSSAYYRTTYQRTSYSNATVYYTNDTAKNSILNIPWTNFNEVSGTVTSLKSSELTKAAIEELRQHLKAIEYKYVGASFPTTGTPLSNVADLDADPVVAWKKFNNTENTAANVNGGLLDGMLGIHSTAPVPSGVGSATPITDTEILGLAQLIEEYGRGEPKLNAGYANTSYSNSKSYSRSGYGKTEYYYYSRGSYYQWTNCGGRYWNYGQLTSTYSNWYGRAGTESNTTSYSNTANSVVTYKNTL